MLKKKLVPAFYFMLMVNFVFGQSSDSIKVMNLSEVNVVATRSEKNNNETPRSITVITAEQIKQSGYISIADALSDAGGMYITGTGQNPGANESLFMRGANSNQVVILVDGVRISDASTVNNTADLSELSIENVDRIEVIRGAHSTLYGSGAVGGVVSIVTKNRNKKGANVRASATGGSFGKKTFDKRAGGQLGYTFESGLYADAGAEKILVDGLDATIDTITDPSAYKNRDRDNWDRFVFHVDAGCHRSKLNVDLSYMTTDMKTDLDKGAYTDDDNYKLDFKRNLVNGNLDWKINRIFSMIFKAGYSDTRRHAVDDSSQLDATGTTDHFFVESTYDGKYNNADVQLNAHLKNADIMGGVSINSEDMDQDDYYFSKQYGNTGSRTILNNISPVTTRAEFIRTELRGSALYSLFSKQISDLLSRYTLSFGFRNSDHSICGVQNAFDGSLSVKTNENSLAYFSYSSGFNNPSLYQLDAPEMHISPNGLTRGNKDLKPESTDAFEIGFKQKPIDRFQYSVSFFHSVTNNLIEFVYLWDHTIGIDTLGNDYMRDDFRGDRYINLGKQTTSGVEINLQTSLSEKLILSANATLVSGKIDYINSSEIESQTNGEHVQINSTGEFLSSKESETGLVRRPSEANLRLIYSPCKSFHIIPSLRYVTQRNDVFYDSSLGPYGALGTNSVDAYTLAGLAITWNLWKGIQINMRADNLFNEKYEEIHGFTTRGRSFYSTLSFSY